MWVNLKRVAVNDVLNDVKTTLTLLHFSNELKFAAESTRQRTYREVGFQPFLPEPTA